MNIKPICHCGQKTLFSECCEPLINQQKHAKTAEQLMRSRFTAFKLRNHQYLLDTQLLKSERDLTVDDFDQQLNWLGLYILSDQASAPKEPLVSHQSEVEFVAFFSRGQSAKFHQLHEKSNFVFKHHKWFYEGGNQLPDIKLARNLPCFCNSGLKFKKCHSLITD